MIVNRDVKTLKGAFLISFDVVNYRFSQDAKQYKHNSALAFSLLLH